MNKERWAQLFSHGRLWDKREQVFEDELTARTQFDADYGRIAFSSAFRRLQDKTQVFPLAKSDFTRTRLTHTLEVANVGRGLGKAFGKHLQRLGQLPAHLSHDDVGTVVGVACLAHDIGNPPFGHSGETSIQEWATRNAAALQPYMSACEYSDITRFEGNAQSFRILARLWDRERAGGARLTLASYGALLKYPQGSGHAVEKADCARKKFNCFQADLALAEAVRAQLSLQAHEAGRFARHPLVYLMEAADDISYRVVDLEDAYEAKLITKADLYERLRPLLPEYLREMDSTKFLSRDPSELRAQAIGELSRAVMVVVREHLDELREGTFKHALIDAVQHTEKDIYDAFEALGTEAKTKVYVDERVLQVEYAGFKVIGGLLDELLGALPPDLEADGKLSKSGEKLFKLFPKKYLVVRPELHGVLHGLKPEAAVLRLTPYERVLAITDFVSGMTDSYALDLHRILTGVRVP